MRQQTCIIQQIQVQAQFIRNSQVQVAHYETSLTSTFVLHRCSYFCNRRTINYLWYDMIWYDLIVDQFVTIYYQIKIINQTTNQIIYFAISIWKQVKFKKNVHAFWTQPKNFSWQQVLDGKQKYKYLQSMIKCSSSTSTNTKYNKSVWQRWKHIN